MTLSQEAQTQLSPQLGSEEREDGIHKTVCQIDFFTLEIQCALTVWIQKSGFIHVIIIINYGKS